MVWSNFINLELKLSHTPPLSNTYSRRGVHVCVNIIYLRDKMQNFQNDFQFQDLIGFFSL